VIAAVVRLDVEPARSAGVIAAVVRLDVGRRDVAAAPGERRCQRRDVGRREIAAVVRLDVEPATSAGVIAAVVRHDVEPATWTSH
jgi:hypothetical protein